MIHSASSSNTLRRRMDWVQDYEKTLSSLAVAATKEDMQLVCSLMDWVGTMTRSLRGPVRSPCGLECSFFHICDSSRKKEAHQRAASSDCAHAIILMRHSCLAVQLIALACLRLPLSEKREEHRAAKGRERKPFQTVLRELAATSRLIPASCAEAPSGAYLAMQKRLLAPPQGHNPFIHEILGGIIRNFFHFHPSCLQSELRAMKDPEPDLEVQAQKPRSNFGIQIPISRNWDLQGSQNS